jgi:sulfur carrier protein
MKIQVNGETRELADGLALREALAALGFEGGPVAVERNGEVVRRAEHATTTLVDGDVLEVVHFVGGG